MGSLSSQIVLTNVVVTTVKPLEKTTHVETIDPTDCDMGTLDTYVPNLFAYRLSENADAVYAQAVNGMKESLRKVLVPFFPWAGRWVATPGGMQRQLLCNDEGVPFIEASVDADMDSVVRFSTQFQPVPELQGWEVVGLSRLSYRQRMLPEGLPCAFIQVTRFKCGGMVVAVTDSHMLADGTSLFHFLTAWSDLSRTNKTDKVLDHNRGAVLPSTPRPLPPIQYSHAQTVVGTMRMYEVSKSAIESLKGEVQESGDGAFVSTVDCIYAHLWKAVSTLPLSINGGKEIGMACVVEGRTRFFESPVPNLLGNVFVMIPPLKISKSDLTEMPSILIAKQIRERMKTTPREKWLSPETQGEVMALFMNDQIIPWVLSSRKSLPLYKIDFGFGTPLFVTGMNTVTVGGNFQGVITVSAPTPGVRSSAACVALWLRSPELLEALESLPDFLPFFVREGNMKA